MRKTHRRRPLTQRDIWFGTASLTLLGLLLAPTFPQSANSAQDGLPLQDVVDSQQGAQQSDGVGGIVAPEINPQDGAPLFWFDDYQAARQVARDAKKPLFVVIRCER